MNPHPVCLFPNVNHSGRSPPDTLAAIPDFYHQPNFEGKIFIMSEPIFTPGMNKAGPPVRPPRDPDAPPLVTTPAVPGHVMGLPLENRIAELERYENRTAGENRELGFCKWALTQEQVSFMGQRQANYEADLLTYRDDIWQYVEQQDEAINQAVAETRATASELKLIKELVLTLAEANKAKDQLANQVEQLVKRVEKLEKGAN
jgi:hypothetical protein